jgi:uncharacterized RDD family membrane protein YckC
VTTENDKPRASLPVKGEPESVGRPEDLAVGLIVIGARMGVRAGRLALLPVRAVGRLPGTTRVQRLAGAVGAEGKAASARGRGQVESVVDRTLAGPLPETVAQMVVDHQLVERIVAEVLGQIQLDEAVAAVLEDERAHDQLQRVLTSPAVERLAASAVESRLVAELTERLLASPQVQQALARQSATFADQLLTTVRRRAAELDDEVTRRIRRVTSRHQDEDTTTSAYGGVVRRTIGLTTDIVLAQLLVLVPAAVLAIVASLVGGLGANWIIQTMLGVGWFIIVAAYFVFFWSTVGQTPGMRLMGLDVVRHDGDPVSAGRAVVRLVGLALSIILLFTGFVPVLFDKKRRGLHDFMAGTVVRSAASV